MILPLSEAKLNYPVEEVGRRTPKKQGDARTASNTCAELALAEEGGGMNNDDTHQKDLKPEASRSLHEPIG